MRVIRLGVYRIVHCPHTIEISTHDVHENTWKCGELKLSVSSSAGGYRKKKKRSAQQPVIATDTVTGAFEYSISGPTPCDDEEDQKNPDTGTGNVVSAFWVELATRKQRCPSQCQGFVCPPLRWSRSVRISLATRKQRCPLKCQEFFFVLLLVGGGRSGYRILKKHRLQYECIQAALRSVAAVRKDAEVHAV